MPGADLNLHRLLSIDMGARDFYLNMVPTESDQVFEVGADVSPIVEKAALVVHTRSSIATERGVLWVP